MISEENEELASAYALGAMSAEEKAAFEAVLAGDPELRQIAAELSDTAIAAMTASAPARPAPADLRSRIIGRIFPPSEHFHVIETVLRATADPVVVTDRDGLVEWVNPAFEIMCGYDLDEVIGQKPGKLLQGEKTDRGAVARLRTAISEARPCSAELINYRKNGEPYWVAINISPVLDTDGEPRCFFAIERELTGRAVAA